MKQIWQRLVLVTGWLVPSGVMAQERFYEWRWEMHPMWWVCRLIPTETGFAFQPT
jgi:hypothetical protein